VARLEVGTSLILPAGAAVNRAGDTADLLLPAPVMAVLVNEENLLSPTVPDSVVLRSGAYVRLLSPVRTESGVELGAGATVFVAAGTQVAVVGKLVDQIATGASCECEVPWFVIIGLGLFGGIAGALLFSWAKE
jgi:hypothetical protein